MPRIRAKILEGRSRNLADCDNWRIQLGPATSKTPSAARLLDSNISTIGCVLTDFHMPEIDGLQLQAGLVARGSCLPVIVMTGYGDVPVAVRAMKAGAVDFLEKPFADAQLIDCIGRALEIGAKTSSLHGERKNALQALDQFGAQCAGSLRAGSDPDHLAEVPGLGDRARPG